MCSRYETPDQAELARAFHVPTSKLPEYKLVAYPGYDEPIIRQTGEGLMAELRFWGNVYPRPHKTQAGKFAYPNYQNAKVETLPKIYKTEWSNNQRCLIPVKRFWEPLKGKMTAVEGDDAVITIAGFFGKTQTKNGERDSFNMITVPANRFMSQFHGANDEKRMPAVISLQDAEEYLSLDTPPDQALKLLKPYQGELVIQKV